MADSLSQGQSFRFLCVYSLSRVRPLLYFAFRAVADWTLFGQTYTIHRDVAAWGADPDVFRSVLSPTSHSFVRRAPDKDLAGLEQTSTVGRGRPGSHAGCVHAVQCRTSRLRGTKVGLFRPSSPLSFLPSRDPESLTLLLRRPVLFSSASLASMELLLIVSTLAWKFDFHSAEAGQKVRPCCPLRFLFCVSEHQNLTLFLPALLLCPEQLEVREGFLRKPVECFLRIGRRHLA